ncbi:proteoglycan 4-like isoform X4 [Plodia interpunctella]|uniref:proteoglycan 4-like isoform X4 n=1 Tax=Plodia interpunctella TaxID=58824 RepID=UPI0023679ACA|nr:proteoglycan 4-like isoform X4 [Plodia interpunctella]
MSNRAWVTLATNDSYGLGALVLAHSLRRAGSAYPSVVLITPSVTEPMRDRLRAVFAEVVLVDVLDSRDATHLALLQRPELGITFTKIHCWGLTQYEKCVFLDADTLIVQNCDELFEREELSAAPDVGWPDCFNSGVFVYRPSAETFEKLIKFAQERGSFDGGDQGLLNSFFSDWARGDINKHLPFLYNVTSAAFYSYLPALKHYGQNLKIIHFIGAAKPWLQQFNFQSRTVDAPEHLREFLQLWWDLFVSDVHSKLDESMSGVAGNLARVVAGVGAPREALDELSRRQGWEAGNIDYMGADSFDNIWAKISQTLNQTRISPPKQPSPPKEPAPKQPSPPKEPAPKQPSPTEEPAIKQPSPPKEPAPKQPSPPKEPAPKQPSPPEEPAIKQPSPPKEPAPKQPSPLKELAPKQPSPPKEPAPKQPSPPKEPTPKQPSPPKEPAPKQPSPPKEPTPKQPSPPKEPAPQQQSPPKESAPKQPSPSKEPPAIAPVEVAQEAVVIEAQAPSPAPVADKTPVPEVPVSVQSIAPTEVPVSEQVPITAEIPAVSDAVTKLETQTDVPLAAEIPSTEIPTTVETPAGAKVSVETPAVEELKIVEPIVPPTPPATPKSSPEASKPDTVSEGAQEPVPVTVEASKAPSSETAKPEATPEKSESSAVTDSPPLANTPSKEETPSLPAAKSEERRKPAGKLQLAPPTAAEPLPTPDSELEDAADLAQSIIASELQPASAPPPPRPTPPSDTLNVAEPEVPTPPVGAISLAQIGVKPKGKSTIAAQIESSVTENPETPPTPTDAPKKKVIKKVKSKEGASGDAPVPPPRKKEKKPKEK